MFLKMMDIEDFCLFHRIKPTIAAFACDLVNSINKPIGSLTFMQGSGVICVDFHGSFDGIQLHFHKDNSIEIKSNIFGIPTGRFVVEKK